MASVIFFEKPGCSNNTRQKRWLSDSGHTVVARNLLTEPWKAENLRRYFGDLAVADWFNPSAPRIKAGEIFPETLDETSALALMLADPLLIRRPLMEVAGTYQAGFVTETVNAWIGLTEVKPEGDLQTCPGGTPLCQTEPAASNTPPPL